MSLDEQPTIHMNLSTDGSTPQFKQYYRRRHVQPADLDAFGGKQVTQHRATRKRKVHVQLVDPPHHGKIGRRHRPWHVCG